MCSVRSNSCLYREWERANKELPLSSWEATNQQQHLLCVVGWSSYRGYSVWLIVRLILLFFGRNPGVEFPVVIPALWAELVLNQRVVIGKAYISIWMLLESINFKSKLSRTKENINKIILIRTSLLTPGFPLHLQVLSTITALYIHSFPHLNSIHVSLQIFWEMWGWNIDQLPLLHWLQLLQTRGWWLDHWKL